MMSSIRVQLEQLDAKMAELQYEVDPQSFTMESIDLDLDELVVEESAPAVIEETVVEESAPAVIEETVVGLQIEEDIPEDLPVEFEEEQVEAPVQEIEDLPEDDVFFQPISEPATVHEVAQSSSSAATAVIDAMTDRQAWRTDMPGASVRDVRSAISLNDRVLFINRLFGEDPMAFQETLNAVNQMTTLDETVNYLAAAHPSWDFSSEIVYRFMMAIRRKLN